MGRGHITIAWRGVEEGWGERGDIRGGGEEGQKEKYEEGGRGAGCRIRRDPKEARHIMCPRPGEVPPMRSVRTCQTLPLTRRNCC